MRFMLRQFSHYFMGSTHCSTKTTKCGWLFFCCQMFEIKYVYDVTQFHNSKDNLENV